MHSNITTESLQVNSSTAYFKQINATPVKNIYAWADNLFRSNKISGALLHTLKAIIACSKLKQPTIQQINAARTRSAARKFAQSSAVTDRTIRRHIQQLEALELIQVTRSRDVNRNSRNAYAIRFVEEVLSCPSEDNMSSSLTLAPPRLDLIPSHSNHTFENLNEYDNFKKGARTEPTKPTKPITPTKLKTSLAQQIASYTAEEKTLHETLQSYGIVVPLIVRYIQAYNLNQIYEKINETKKRCKNPGKLGAYIRQSIENIPNDFTGAPTGGKIHNNKNVDTVMGKPAAPSPSEIETLPLLAAADDRNRAAKQPKIKAQRVVAMSEILAKLKLETGKAKK